MKNSDQNIIAIIIAIGSLMCCYIYFYRLDAIEQTIKIIQESGITCNIDSVMNLIDRNVRVFTVLVSSLFSILSIMLGIIGYSWVRTKISDAEKGFQDKLQEFKIYNKNSFDHYEQVGNENQELVLKSLFTLNSELSVLLYQKEKYDRYCLLSVNALFYLYQLNDKTEFKRYLDHVEQDYSELKNKEFCLNSNDKALTVGRLSTIVGKHRDIDSTVTSLTNLIQIISSK